MKTLFDKSGNPHSPDYITKCIKKFASDHKRAVQRITLNSKEEISYKVFSENAAILLSSFKMTQSGPFEGVKFTGLLVEDPNKKISGCWKAIEKDLLDIRKSLDRYDRIPRERKLVEIPPSGRKIIISHLKEAFEKLLPLSMTSNSYGWVAASKILFSILPEVALNINDDQSKENIQSFNYGNRITRMANEIKEWEETSKTSLSLFLPVPNYTLPAVYNVMGIKNMPK